MIDLLDIKKFNFFKKQYEPTCRAERVSGSI